LVQPPWGLVERVADSGIRSSRRKQSPWTRKRAVKNRYETVSPASYPRVEGIVKKKDFIGIRITRRVYEGKAIRSILCLLTVST